jgi:Holliday junction resolvasome RuvABC endonuclease subunit
LDLGTKTGYASLIDGREASGTWVLAKPSELHKEKVNRLDRRNDIRITRLFDLISSYHATARFDWAFFEDVNFLSTQLQAQLWASLRAAVWLNGRDGSLQIDCVPVGTLKKFATGNGSATKDMMAHALRCTVFKTGVKSRPFKFELNGVEIDDNEIDAKHLLNFAKQKLKI